MAAVLRQIDLVTRFVGYQRAYSTKSGIETAIEGCRSLLQEQDINSAVRKGDIYGFLIEHYSKIQNFRYFWSQPHKQNPKMRFMFPL